MLMWLKWLPLHHYLNTWIIKLGLMVTVNSLGFLWLWQDLVLLAHHGGPRSGSLLRLSPGLSGLSQDLPRPSCCDTCYKLLPSVSVGVTCPFVICADIQHFLAKVLSKTVWKLKRFSGLFCSWCYWCRKSLWQLSGKYKVPAGKPRKRDKNNTFPADSCAHFWIWTTCRYLVPKGSAKSSDELLSHQNTCDDCLIAAAIVINN